MSIKLTSKFPFRNRGSEKSDIVLGEWIFVESSDFAVTGQTWPALSLEKHLGFIQRAIKKAKMQCLWFVETASDSAMERLEANFPDHQRDKWSIGGRFEPRAEYIKSFWTVFAQLYNEEPWNNEQPWVMAGIRHQSPNPQKWTVESLLMKSGAIDCVFVQTGWFAYFGIRRTSITVEEIRAEFPGLVISSD